MVKAKKKYRFDPDYAVPPGETLKEFMESRGMTQRELAVRTGLTVQTLNRIFKGEQPITYETANRLELATNLPAHMWNNLEMQFQEQLAKIREKELLKADLAWLKLVPTRELIERGAIEKQDNPVDLLREVLKFFGVSSVRAWRELWEKPQIAARRSKCFETKPFYAAVWIRLGEIQAHKINCRPFDRKGFAEAIQHIRGLVREEPGVFMPRMISLCADAGVALALIPEMKKVPWNGATKWLATDKAMILLNLRGKMEDIFWFSFFHEAGHVLNDSPKNTYINDETSNNPCEKAADEFADKILIPARWNGRISTIRTKEEITSLADKLGVSPGIVVGRFQHLTGKWNYFNGLKRKFSWGRSA